MKQATCRVCDRLLPISEFTPSEHRNTRMRCRRCAVERGLAQDERQRGPWITVHCGWCKAPVQQRERANRKRKFCSRSCGDRQKKFLQSIALHLAKPLRWCAWCGTKLSIFKRSDAYYCVDQCLNDAHVATANFRRRVGDTKMRVEPRFSMFSLGERDGWTCGICSEPIDMTLKHPHAMSNSFDHIVPIARGGAHLDPANLRLAHLGCNVQRGARS